MNNISDQSNMCPICDTKSNKLLVEVNYEVIKNISNYNNIKVLKGEFLSQVQVY